jgi:predicted O-methyltransferase YrrM
MRAFPDCKEWASAVLHADDRDRHGRPEFHAYYRTKYLLAAMFQPAAIAEIGVRRGYSAWSFLRACPTAAYHGFDKQAGTHGGAGVTSFDWFLMLAGRDFPDADIQVERLDTQTLASLGGPYDLIHIDGDHSKPGCYRDLGLADRALAPGGVIVVDDYRYIAGVRRGVDRFVRDHPTAFPERIEVPSLRGEYVLRRPR